MFSAPSSSVSCLIVSARQVIWFGDEIVAGVVLKWPQAPVMLRLSHIQTEQILLSTDLQLNYHHDMFRSSSSSLEPETPHHQRLTGTSTLTVSLRRAGGGVMVKRWRSDGGAMAER